MDSNLYISALQRQPCLLKTNSTRVLLTWLITLLLIICPSSYKARPDNLIGTSSSLFRPNGAMSDRTSRPQMLWEGLSSAGTQAKPESLLWASTMTTRGQPGQYLIQTVILDHKWRNIQMFTATILFKCISTFRFSWASTACLDGTPLGETCSMLRLHTTVSS